MDAISLSGHPQEHPSLSLVSATLLAMASVFHGAKWRKKEGLTRKPKHTVLKEQLPGLLCHVSASITFIRPKPRGLSCLKKRLENENVFFHHLSLV